jgi:hypothetical protein
MAVVGDVTSIVQFAGMVERLFSVKVLPLMVPPVATDGAATGVVKLHTPPDMLLQVALRPTC